MTQSTHKFSTKAISLLLTLCMLVGLIVPFTITVGAAKVTADTSWYVGHEDDTEYVLYDAADLMGFYELGGCTAASNNMPVEKELFTGKTIKLGADIDLNPGWEAKVIVSGNGITLPSSPDNQWKFGIAAFEGTFDGQGHTISGLYAYKNKTQTRDYGGFITRLRGGTLKNVSFKNSIVVWNQNVGVSGSRLGGVVADLEKGTIENVYSDTQIVLQSNNSNQAYIGGIVGATNWVNDDTTVSTVTNCVYEGNIYFTTAQNGTTIGAPSSKSRMVGGIAGVDFRANFVNNLGMGTLTATNVPSVADFSLSGNTASGFAPVVARLYPDDPLTSDATRSGNLGGPVAEADMPATGWTWRADLETAVPAGASALIPEKQAFVPELKTDADINDFDIRDLEGSSYLIEDAADMKKFIALANEDANNALEGKIFKLTADIDMNPGWSAGVPIEDGTVVFPSAPSYAWARINHFAGTLDGQGHSLSGLYCNRTLGDSEMTGGIFWHLDGGVVENLVISNSLLMANRGGWGSANQKFGGFAGEISDGARISNVFFNADVWFKGDNHRVFGGVAAVASGECTIENFVFNGNFGVAGNANDYAHKATTGCANGYLIGHGNGAVINLNNILITAVNGNSNMSGSAGTDNINYLVHYGATNVTGADTVKIDKQSAEIAGWVWDANLSSYSPITLSADYVRLDVNAPINSFDEKAKSGSSYVITSAQDLLTFAEKMRASEGNGNGYIFRLTADVDLNPGWSAEVTTSDGTVTFPSAPSQSWAGINNFEGTFDGGNHYIAGLYRIENAASGWQYFGGFVNNLYGTVRNLKIVNSLVKVKATSKNPRIGGLAGQTKAGAVIDNVYLDMGVWAASDVAVGIGGFVGHASAAMTLSNSAFVGTVGIAKANGTDYPSTTTSGSLGMAIGDPAGLNNIKITNVVLAGQKFISDSNVRSGDVYGIGIDTVRSSFPALKNVVVGGFASISEANSAGKISGYDYSTMALTVSSKFGVLLPTSVVNMGLDNLPDGRCGEPTSIQNYTGKEGKDQVFTLSTVTDLIYAAELSQSGEKFGKYTLRLENDIDLNPGWNANVETASGTAVLPEVPTVRFPGFATFSGIFDGQNHTISGIYMMKTFSSNSQSLGFIDELRGTVRNLKFNNGLVLACMNNAENDTKVAGVAARVTGSGSTIENVYVDLQLFAKSDTWQRIGGIAGKVDGNNVTINNAIFAGKLGGISHSLTIPSTSTNMKVSQMVADGNYKTTLVISNFEMNGTVFAAAGVETTKAVGSNDKPEMTIIEGTATVEAPAAYTKQIADFDIFPTATVDSKTASYEANTTTQVYYYEEITAANFAAYIAALKDAGYTELQTYTIADNEYYLLQNDYYTVYASLLTSTGSAKLRARVYVEPYGRDYDLDKTATKNSTYCTAQLWQLNTDNWYQKAAGGASYVLRLTDGKFIVIDGGYGSIPETNNLYKILYENNVRDGNPVIAGWFLTHAHSDHTGCLDRFRKEDHKYDITVEAFYYNFPTNEVEDTSGNDDGMTLKETISPVIAMTAYEGAQLYSKVHSGMSFGFTGATATILFTHEDASQSVWNGSSLTANELYDGNDTSLVIKFTVGTETILFTGDACQGASAAMLGTYDSATLKTHIMTVSHHGFNGLSKAAYQAIDADVALWPQDVVLYAKNGETVLGIDDDGTFKDRLETSGFGGANDWIENNMTEIIPAFENACLSLPYTAMTYTNQAGFGKSGNHVNLQSVYNLKSTNTNLWDGLGKGTNEIEIDEWYDADADELNINSRKDLFDFMKAGQSHDFEGQTINLNVDITLNPTWDENALVSDGFLASELVGEASAWTPIKTFKGTFNGNGHILRNFYADLSTGMTGTYGGFIKTLSGGTVQNLIFQNSAVIFRNATGSGSSSLFCGALIGEVVYNENQAVLENLYLDIDTYYVSNNHACFAAMIGTVKNGSHKEPNPDYDAAAAALDPDNYDVAEEITVTDYTSYAVRNVVYAGDVATATPAFGKLGDQITLGNDQNMWGPVVTIGKSTSSLVNGEPMAERTVENVVFTGTLTGVSNNKQNMRGVIYESTGFGTPDIVSANIYAEPVSEKVAEDDELEGWTYATNYGTMMPDDVFGMIDAVYQPVKAQQTEEYTVNEKEVRDLRFVGVLEGVLESEELSNYNEVGMKIASFVNGVKKFEIELSTDTVYSSINAGDSVFTKEEAGGYLYAFIVSGVPVSTQMSFELTAFYVNDRDEKETKTVVTVVYDGDNGGIQ